MEGYKNLTTFIFAEVIHDLTLLFCKKYISTRSRTYDQMEQAARSGKQNIAEGYSVESLESYIKLLGVSFGSIKELSLDFEDFLRQRGWQSGEKITRKSEGLDNLELIGFHQTTPIPPISPIPLNQPPICF